MLSSATYSAASIGKPTLGTARILTSTELRIAGAGCHDARRRLLITDPLNYPEWQVPDFVEVSCPQSEVDAEFLTRPKQSGGIRLEILPDFGTSTYLQAVANRLSERDLNLEYSLSARLFGLQFAQENPYEVWSGSVPTWIRGELDNGRTVIIADIRNYFGSVAPVQIKAALERATLETAIIDEVLILMDKLNSLSDPKSTTCSGIPVAPDEFFWLVSDLVLGPTDIALKGDPAVLSHARWVDDYFLSTARGMGDRAVGRLALILAEHGFSLNEDKTRIFSSVEQFEQATLAPEHQIITDLFLTSSAGAISVPQKARISALIEQAPTKSIDDLRLWKRLYALAHGLRSPLLLDRAQADLDRLPGAELPILGYIGAFGWDHLATDKLAMLLFAEQPDTRSLSTLRALLASPADVPSELTSSLLRLVRSPPTGVHAFSRVLAYACLVKMPSSRARSEAAEALLYVLGSLRSATTRRVGIELLWLQPRLRPQLRQMIRQDSSPWVRSLAHLIDDGGRVGRKVDRRIRHVPSRPPSLIDWGGLDARLANAFSLPLLSG